MGLDMYLSKINRKVTDSNDLKFKIQCDYYSKKYEELKEFTRKYKEFGLDRVLEEKILNLSPDFVNAYLHAKKSEDALVKKTFLEEHYFKSFDKLNQILTDKAERLINIFTNYDFNLIITSLGYFRKHSDLHGYMNKLYVKRGGTEVFNCQPLILSKEDVENVIELAEDIIKGDENSPQASGFFWGESDVDDWENTLKVFTNILNEVDFQNETLYYDSWW